MKKIALALIVVGLLAFGLSAGPPALAQTATPTATPTWTSAGGIRIDSGSAAGSVFSGNYWYPGSTYASGGLDGSTTGIDVLGTTDDGMYLNWRAASLNASYNISIAAGTYTVRLHFAEFDATNGPSRVFDISIEGILVADDFSIFATAGNALNTAVIREFTVASNNTLTITVTGVNSTQARLMGVEVYPPGSVPTLTPQAASATPTATTPPAASATPTATTPAADTATPTATTPPAASATPTATTPAADTATPTATTPPAASTATPTATTPATDTATPTATTPPAASTATPTAIAAVTADFGDLTTNTQNLYVGVFALGDETNPRRMLMLGFMALVLGFGIFRFVAYLAGPRWLGRD